MCTNSGGSYVCSCNSGYELDGDGNTCNDVDECVNSSPCDSANGMCENSGGSYVCSCNSGYELDGDGSACNDIDECASAPCLHGGRCADEVNSYTCTCADGYTGTRCETARTQLICFGEANFNCKPAVRGFPSHRYVTAN
eukprot:XP_011668852.1 PREDICTED: fibulin-7-like [Strongylocentrotus purpuratus]